MCNSCWDFNATGAPEGQGFWKIGRCIPLSEQNLLDYYQSQGNESCNCGLTDNALQYVKYNGGLGLEKSYPYHAKVESCKYKSKDSVANDTGFVDTHQKDKSLMKAVAIVGPISVAIDASQDSFYEEARL